jgi:hypothetical protein
MAFRSLSGSVAPGRCPDDIPIILNLHDTKRDSTRGTSDVCGMPE